MAGERLVVGIDDTPTPRWGPHVAGAGIHHNPTPGPAGAKFSYGHVWVTLAALVKHSDWGTRALPLSSHRSIRQKDIERLPPDQRVPLRAGHQQGWQQVRCVQYREEVVKTIKTFLATWKPAGGLIRVVLVQEADEWRAYLSTNPQATPEEILEAVADRGALAETFKDVKEVWGAGQQQVRKRHANVGCVNRNGWRYSLVEAWSWEQAAEALVDRQASPWDEEYRRPSHTDRRKALQRQMLRTEIQTVLAGRPTKEEIRNLAERLLELAA